MIIIFLCWLLNESLLQLSWIPAKADMVHDNLSCSFLFYCIAQFDNHLQGLQSRISVVLFLRFWQFVIRNQIRVQLLSQILFRAISPSFADASQCPDIMNIFRNVSLRRRLRISAAVWRCIINPGAVGKQESGGRSCGKNWNKWSETIRTYHLPKNSVQRRSFF